MSINSRGSLNASCLKNWFLVVSSSRPAKRGPELHREKSYWELSHFLLFPFMFVQNQVSVNFTSSPPLCAIRLVDKWQNPKSNWFKKGGKFIGSHQHDIQDYAGFSKAKSSFSSNVTRTSGRLSPGDKKAIGSLSLEKRAHPSWHSLSDSQELLICPVGVMFSLLSRP